MLFFSAFTELFFSAFSSGRVPWVPEPQNLNERKLVRGKERRKKGAFFLSLFFYHFFALVPRVRGGVFDLNLYCGVPTTKSFYPVLEFFLMIADRRKIGKNYTPKHKGWTKNNPI